MTDVAAARGEHRQGRHPRRRRRITCATRASGSRRRPRPDRGRSRPRCRTRSTRSRRARRRTRHLRRRRRRARPTTGSTCRYAAGYTGLMVGVGLRGVGHRLVLPAVRLLRRLLSRSTTPTSRPTATPPGTTRGPAPTGAAPWPTDRTAGWARPRATTRAPEPTRAARWRGDRTARAGAAQAWNPRTGAYAQTRQGSNIYGSWGSSYVQRGDDWAQTSRVTNRVTGNTTRVTRTDEGAAISRNTPGPAAAASSPRATAATSTPGATATSTSVKTGRGRSTRTATGAR